MTDITLRQLSEEFLSWCEMNRSEALSTHYRHFLDKFVEQSAEADHPAISLKPFVITRWIDSHGDKWGESNKHASVVTLKRMYRWGHSQGHITQNPLDSVTNEYTPQARRTYMTTEDYEQMVKMLSDNDAFKNVLVFAWNTGARPQEIRHIEPRHVDIKRALILFPKNESKGKRYERKIFLNATSLEIITKLLAKNKTQKLFVNNDGASWRKEALCDRMSRLSKSTLGKSLSMYDIRHGFATKKIREKRGLLHVAAQMGHRNGNTLATIYSHIHEEDEEVRSILD